MHAHTLEYLTFQGALEVIAAIRIYCHDVCISPVGDLCLVARSEGSHQPYCNGCTSISTSYASRTLEASAEHNGLRSALCGVLLRLRQDGRQACVK